MDLTKNDYQLINKCRNHDKEAFNQLIPKILKDIKSQIYIYIKFECYGVTIDDVTQEVLIKIWRSIPALKKLEAFKSWVKIIIRHACYDILRQTFKYGKGKQVYLSDVIFENDDSEIQMSIADPKQDVEYDLEKQEKFSFIDNSLNAMNIEFRSAYELIKMQELTYEQAADVLQIPMGTVKSRLWRAKQKLLEDVETIYNT
jgi:RNA polymerase sigma-70 factor, ECF subfamily